MLFFNYCVIWCLLGKDFCNNMLRLFYIKDEYYLNWNYRIKIMVNELFVLILNCLFGVNEEDFNIILVFIEE